MHSPSSAPPSDTFELLGGTLQLPRSFVLQNAYLRDGDGAFVGGSLIEGTGNRFSDVDVHVVTERLRLESEIDMRRHYRVLSPDRSILAGDSPQAPVFLIHTVVPQTHVKVDIEYRTTADVDALADGVDQVFAYAVRSLMLLTKYMAARDMAFIHRLFRSQDLCGSPALDGLRTRIGMRRFQYLLYRWKASDFSVLLDILGAWEEGDLLRCADMARENMVTQFHAYTHLCGSTNYHRKWIIKYACRCGVEEALLARYLHLLGAECGGEPQRSADYILAVLDFVDELFAAGAQRLQADYPEVSSGPDACAAIDALARSQQEEYSQMEVDYRKKAYGAAGRATRSWFAP